MEFYDALKAKVPNEPQDTRGLGRIELPKRQASWVNRKGIRRSVSKPADSKSTESASPGDASPADPQGRISDRQLLQRHLTGDEGAFGMLVNRYRRPLYNFLARFSGDPALAEDIFQETFLQLHLSAGAFDPTRRLKPWLFTIAANKARDAMRSRTRRQAAPLDATIAGGGDSESRYADLMPSNIPDPSESLVNLETRRAVQTIVQDMPENLRTVLLLNYFHDFAYKEIAEMLNLPLGTIKSRLHAAVKYFGKRWKAAVKRNGNDEPKNQ